jgi:hypothetical protein
MYYSTSFMQLQVLSPVSVSESLQLMLVALLAWICCQD